MWSMAAGGGQSDAVAERETKKVWYCSYGSNMMEQRFFAYIRGGSVPGLQALGGNTSAGGRVHKGCSDSAIPAKTLPIAFPAPILFAGKSRYWGAAPAHLNLSALDGSSTARSMLVGSSLGPAWAGPEKVEELARRCSDGYALGRAYLITEEQFWEVVEQENYANRLREECSLAQHLGAGLAEEGKLKLTEDAAAGYDHLLFFGYHEGYPMVSFSGNRSAEDLAGPNAAYLYTLIRGLRETFHMDQTGKAIGDYLHGSGGLSHTLSKPELCKIVDDCFTVVEEENSNRLVWYSSYGSNMWRERFMCYIQGGSPKGSASVQRGAVDSTAPRSTRPICYKKEVFFGRKHPFWHAATCYLNVYDGADNSEAPCSEDYLIVGNELGGQCWEAAQAKEIARRMEEGEPMGFGRMYLITEEQFLEVLRQENNEQCVDVDFTAASQELVTCLDPTSYYGDLVSLGVVEGHPVFSFTGQNKPEQFGQKPSVPYIRTIVRGLRDTFNLPDDDILDYLACLRGIKGHFTRAELLPVIDVE